MEFYIGDTIVYPDNARNFKVSFQADDAGEGTTISESFVEFSKVTLNNVPSEGFKICNNHIANGNHALGLKFKIMELGQVYFDGLLDFTSVETSIGCNKISVKLLETNQSIKEILNALSFDLLEFKGVITKADYLPIRISEENVPDAEKASILLLTLYQMSKEVNEAVKDILNPLNVPYLLVQIPLLVALVKKIVEENLPTDRFYYGMRIRTLFQKICDYMGLEFESSIIPSFATLLPDKDKRAVANLDNALDKGYEDLTAGQFIERMEKLFYARVKIQDNILRFERIDYYWQNDSGIQLPELQPDQRSYATNLDELSPYRVLKYARDDQDNFTRKDTVGYICQSTVEIPSTSNQDLILSNLEDIQLDYTRGTRKNQLSELEQSFASLVNPLFDAIEGVTSAIGLSVDLPQIPDRVGALRISGQSLGVPKYLLVSDNGDLLVQNDFETKALTMYNNYHSIGSIINNQWRIYPQLQVSIEKFTDVIALKDNNYVRDAEGNICLIEANERDDKCLHTITYRAKKDYLNNQITEVVTEK